MTTKTAFAVLISLWALLVAALAEANSGFDGTWVGEEQTYKAYGMMSQIFYPTFIIANNGTRVARLNGPAAGRFDNIVLKGKALHFGAGNTTFELRLSDDGNTLNETMHVVVKRNFRECWLTGHYHRQ